MAKYSLDKEIEYYKGHYPTVPLPYLHLEPYLSSWLPYNVFEGKKVLDIGAGECVYSRLIADKFNPDSVTAFELFEERMRPARLDNKNTKLRFVQGNIFELDSILYGSKFDVIFGSLILHQLPDLEDIIVKLKSILTSKGVYIGIEPNPYNLVILYRYLFKRHSGNQYLLGPKQLSLFSKHDFDISYNFFYAKYPFLKNRLLTTCLGIMANLH